MIERLSRFRQQTPWDPPQEDLLATHPKDSKNATICMHTEVQLHSDALSWNVHSWYPCYSCSLDTWKQINHRRSSLLCWSRLTHLMNLQSLKTDSQVRSKQSRKVLKWIFGKRSFYNFLVSKLSCPWQKPTKLAHSFYIVLVSVSVFMALSTVFHSINSPNNSPLSHSVLLILLCLTALLCSSDLTLPYWSFQLYISLWKSPSALI